MPGLLLPRSRPEDQGLPSAAVARLVGALDLIPHVHTLTVARHGRVVAEFARLMESGGPKAEALVLPLSPREREILSLLGSGASNKEIADRLNLAEGTVKNHVTNILTKLDVRDRTQAAIRARQLGIA